MNITVRFFANLREATGTSQLALEVPDGADLHIVVSQLIASYPHLEGQQAMWNFAVNQTHAEADVVLHAGDRVTIFPYVAGG
jgi:molybdopterin converting factor subunit 1